MHEFTDAHPFTLNSLHDSLSAEVCEQSKSENQQSEDVRMFPQRHNDR